MNTSPRFFSPVRFREKSADTYFFEVCGLPFGGPVDGKDLQRQWFTEKTDFQMSIGDQIPSVYYHGRNSTGQRVFYPEFYGKATLVRFDEDGGWFEIPVDRSKSKADDLVKAAQEGRLRGSTGVAGSLARFLPSGEAVLWVPGEISLVDQGEGRRAVNDYAIGIHKLKALYEKNNLPWSEALEKARQADLSPAQGVNTMGNSQINTDDLTNKISQIVVAALAGSSPDPDTSPPPEKAGQADDPSKNPAPDFGLALELALEKTLPSVLRKLNPAEAPPAFNTKHYPLDLQFWGEKAVNEPMEAFNDWFKSGQPNDDLTDYMGNGGEKAAWQEATDSEGGYTVLDTVENKIIEYRDEVSIARIMGAQVLLVSGKVHDIPIENTRLSDFAITAEEGAWDEDEGDLGVAAITNYKFTKLQKTSIELAEDSEVDLLRFYVSRWGRARGLTENNYFLVGTGSSQPQGALVGGTAAQTLAGATSITMGEVQDNYFALPQPYREEGACWCLKGSTNSAIRQLVGDPFYFQDQPAGHLSKGVGPDSLVFRRAFESSKMPALTTGLKCLLFGNWKYYLITERKGTVIVRDDSLYRANGQIGHFVHYRQGGAVSIAEAFQYSTAA